VSAWKGIFPSVPTAFRRDGSLDLQSQRAVARFAVDSGADGMLCFGLAGEVFRLTPSERRELLEVMSDEVAGRIPILAGVGAEATHTSIALAQDLRAAGADGVVIPPPITTRPSRQELLRYFEQIVDAAELPAMIQDAPEYLGVDLGPAVVLEAARRAPAIRFAKLEAGADGIAEWVQEAEGALAIFGGNCGLYLLDCLDHDAAGVAPGTDVTDLLTAVYGVWRDGQADAAWTRFRALLPLLVYQASRGIDHFNASSKHVLVRRGVLADASLRSPAAGIGEVAVGLLDRYVAELGIVATEPVG
jgi:4-hydroxy-tetrahydrodipicolinate synthase